MRRLQSFLNTTKNKVGAAVICGILVSTVGLGTAYAANAFTSLQVRNVNGTTSYSTDGGQTWTDKAPDGAAVNNDGSISMKSGNPDADGGAGLLTKVENGVASYSTDGGNTWSNTAPDGAETKTQFGAGTVEGSLSANTGGTSLQVRNINGVINYSTDGGQTWTDRAPDGATVNDDGSISMKSGNAAENTDGKGLLTKVENGVRTYSTDGGNTWTDQAPEGAEDSVTIGE